MIYKNFNDFKKKIKIGDKFKKIGNIKPDCCDKIVTKIQSNAIIFNNNSWLFYPKKARDFVPTDKGFKILLDGEDYFIQYEKTLIGV